MNVKIVKRFLGWSLPTKIGIILALIGMLFLPFFDSFSVSPLGKIQQNWHNYNHNVFIETDMISGDLSYLELAKVNKDIIIELPYGRMYGVNANFYTIINSRVYDLTLRKDRPLSSYISQLDFSDYYTMNKNYTIWKFGVHNNGHSSLTNSKLDIHFLNAKILNFSSSCTGSDTGKFNLNPDMSFLQFRKIIFEPKNSCVISVTVHSLEIPEIEFSSNEKSVVDLIEPGTSYFIFQVVKIKPPITIFIFTPTIIDSKLQEQLNGILEEYRKKLSREVILNISYPYDEFNISYPNETDVSLIETLEKLLNKK